MFPKVIPSSLHLLSLLQVVSDNFPGARGGGGYSLVGLDFALFLGGEVEVEGAGDGFLIAAFLCLISVKRSVHT